MMTGEDAANGTERNNASENGVEGQKLDWRATADEDGQYCFAVAL
jgi:hypothetical protein